MIEEIIGVERETGNKTGGKSFAMSKSMPFWNSL
jgi:hypothetical protein